MMALRISKPIFWHVSKIYQDLFYILMRHLNCMLNCAKVMQEGIEVITIAFRLLILDPILFFLSIYRYKLHLSLMRYLGAKCLL